MKARLLKFDPTDTHRDVQEYLYKDRVKELEGRVFDKVTLIIVRHYPPDPEGLEDIFMLQWGSYPNKIFVRRKYLEFIKD